MFQIQLLTITVFLHGVWIDVTLNMDDIQEQVSEMLKAIPLDEEAKNSKWLDLQAKTNQYQLF